MIFFKIILFIYFFFTCLELSIGQIVLDTTDLPAIGDVQTTRVVDSAEAVSLLPGNSGPDVIWDFSTLTFCCIDYLDSRWVNPQYTDSNSFFHEADIALKTHCYPYHNPQTHIVTEICDYRDYYIKDNTGLNYYGSDFPYPHTVSNYRNVLPLLTYGQTTTNNTRIVIQKSVDSVLVTHIKDTIIADGWGTIITPINTYEAIRIFTKEIVRDSIYINGVGIQTDYMPQNYYYKWYTKGLGFPVFQISKGITETNKDYQIARAALGKSFEASVPEIIQPGLESYTFPNPASGEVKINISDVAKNCPSTLFVLDLQGKAIFHKECKSSDELFIKSSDICNGFYFYKIIFKDGTTTKGKFVIGG